MRQTLMVFVNQIKKERKFQIKKWGEQKHEHHVWWRILYEEAGEAIQAYNERDNVSLIKELVQTASVAWAWYEYIMQTYDIPKICKKYDYDLHMRLSILYNNDNNQYTEYTHDLWACVLGKSTGCLAHIVKIPLLPSFKEEKYSINTEGILTELLTLVLNCALWYTKIQTDKE